MNQTQAFGIAIGNNVVTAGIVKVTTNKRVKFKQIIGVEQIMALFKVTLIEQVTYETQEVHAETIEQAIEIAETYLKEKAINEKSRHLLNTQVTDENNTTIYDDKEYNGFSLEDLKSALCIYEDTLIRPLTDKEISSIYHTLNKYYDSSAMDDYISYVIEEFINDNKLHSEREYDNVTGEFSVKI